MTIDRGVILDGIAARLPVVEASDAAEGNLEIAALARGWLTDCREGGTGPGAADLDALCRQIDVRRRLSSTYRPGWQRFDPEVPADDGVVEAIVGVLLAVAERVPDRGRDLKLVNSALKALDRTGDGGSVPALRAWAVELLDRATMGDAP